ncbi:MAG: radical SAM protein [Planctomycetota bacterium]|jgi:radical SAM protein with 4Fe4S-binding SPASM domain
MHRPARQPSKQSANLEALRLRAARLTIPASATWELTYRCPLDCRHCYLEGLRGEDELDTAEAKALLGAMARAGVLFLTLTGGEPLAREDFLEIAAETRRLGFAWRLYTAGTLVDDGLARALAELGPLAVDISLHGLEGTHDDLTRTPGSFRAAADAAERLADLGLTVNFKTNLTPRGLADLPELRALAERIGAGHKIATFLFPPHAGGRCEEGLVLSEDRFADYVAASERLRPSGFGRGQRPCPEDPLCAAGRSVFAVSPGGDVRACLMLKEVCGNVRETDFAEIWRSEGMAALRRTTFEARRGCLDCDDAEFCFPCPGLAEKETGDLLAAPPTACREARLRHELARASGVEADAGTAPPREGCVEP